MTVSSLCRFFRFTISFFASPIKCYRNGLRVFQARKHEKAKPKSEKLVPCSQAVSVNHKLYEDGIDADVPQARIFCGWNHELLSLTTNYSINTRIGGGEMPSPPVFRG